jgi:hypothetical protein
MRALVFSLVLGLLAAAGCGSSGSDLTPQTACNEEIAALCNWASRCGGQSTLAAMGGYTSVSDCTSKMQATECAGTNSQCDSGKTFHADKAQACVDGTNSMACPTSSNSSPPTSAACDQVCQ